MSDPTLLIFSQGGGRKPGRPKSSEPTSAISARLPAKYHDAIIRLANERSVSVSAFVGGILSRIAKNSGKA